jgi:hypothetical protein
MIKEPGAFSKKYLTRRGKENFHQNQDPKNEEIDFPLAFTSAKSVTK